MAEKIASLNVEGSHNNATDLRSVYTFAEGGKRG